MAEPEQSLLNNPNARCMSGTFTLSIPTDCPRCGEGVEALKHFLTDQFGGYTSWKGEGCWMDPDQKGQGLVCEGVQVFEVAHKCLSPAQTKLLMDFIDHSGLFMEQSEMAIKTGQWMFVKPRESRH